MKNLTHLFTLVFIMLVASCCLVAQEVPEIGETGPCGLYGPGTNGTDPVACNTVNTYSVDLSTCDNCTGNTWSWTLALEGGDATVNNATSFPVVVQSNIGISAEIIYASNSILRVRWVCDEDCVVPQAFAEIYRCGSEFFNPIVRIDTGCSCEPSFAYCALLECGTFCLELESGTFHDATAQDETLVCFQEPVVNISNGECRDVDTKSNQGSTRKGQSIGFQVYPNPSAGYFNVKLPSFDGVVKMRVMSIDGVIITERTVTSPQQLEQFDLPLAPGVYIVQVQLPQQLLSTKVIVE
ncbi:MAG: T9SS type A sorting domain-containing protein [Bacteroidota bacterium]